VVVSVACYKLKFVIVYLFTLLTIHMGLSTCDTRQTTNYFLHTVNYSLTNHNSFCPLALPGILGCGHSTFEWACQWLSMADLRKILFWKKALICNNVIVRTLANISKCSIGLILSKYCIQSISVNTNNIKLRMWKHFVDDCAEHGRVTFY